VSDEMNMGPEHNILALPPLTSYTCLSGQSWLLRSYVRRCSRVPRHAFDPTVVVFSSRLEIFRRGGVAEEEVGEDSGSLERVSFTEIK
jgi:hypothetical protein